MRIVHIAPNAPYNEGWGYQENLLPKYQAKLGHEVTLIITNLEHKDGKKIEVNPTRYESRDGFYVVRKPIEQFKKNIPGSTLLEHINIKDLLYELKPDIIFFHGLVNVSIFQAVNYKRKSDKNVSIIEDNHMDYNIGFNPRKSIKIKLVCQFYKIMNKIVNPYIDHVYGVTPWRCTYAEKVLGVPRNKISLLMMGADDEKLNLDSKSEIRNEIRNKFNISKSDFVIVSGGKINKKKKIDILAKACLKNEKVKLLLFGSLEDDVKEEILNIIHESNNIRYIGWIASDQVYEYFFASDLVFFPGQHSVLWEQACASKVPCVFEKWDGMEHVNNGGNAKFISPITENNIDITIKSLLFTPEYYKMKEISESEVTDIYLYSRIAKDSFDYKK